MVGRREVDRFLRRSQAGMQARVLSCNAADARAEGTHLAQKERQLAKKSGASKRSTHTLRTRYTCQSCMRQQYASNAPRAPFAPRTPYNWVTVKHVGEPRFTGRQTDRHKQTTHRHTTPPTRHLIARRTQGHTVLANQHAHTPTNNTPGKQREPGALSEVAPLLVQIWFRFGSDWVQISASLVLCRRSLASFDFRQPPIVHCAHRTACRTARHVRSKHLSLSIRHPHMSHARIALHQPSSTVRPVVPRKMKITSEKTIETVMPIVTPSSSVLRNDVIIATQSHLETFDSRSAAWWPRTTDEHKSPHKWSVLKKITGREKNTKHS